MSDNDKRPDPDEITNATEGDHIIESDTSKIKVHDDFPGRLESVTDPYTTIHSDNNQEKDHKSTVITATIYGVLAIIIAIVMVLILFSSPASGARHNPSPESLRDGLLWESTPSGMEESWSLSGYQNVINSPGAIIGVKENGVERINSQNGEKDWSYYRDDATLCHAIDAGGNVAVLFNSGKGCSDITMLDGATGERINYAMYGVEDDTQEARLVHGQENIAIVTSDRVRFLSMSLSPVAEFGSRPDPVYSDDQVVSDCTIADVAIGPLHGIVSSMCTDAQGRQQTSYHINAVNLDPDESTMGEIEMSVDTKSSDQVTIPMVSLAQVLFLTQGTAPTLYAWQLDKSQEEISATPMSPGEFPRGYWDVPNIGYVWLIGETVHVRYGSEDISQSVTYDQVIGNPLPAHDKLILPQRGSITLWDPATNESDNVPVEGFYGTDFAFSGETVASFDRSDSEGTITGYTPVNEEGN